MKLSKDQQEALELMLSGANVFLTGKAGTGKSTVLREFRKRNSRSAVFVAPTGIAALNIEGQTIHSCFQIKPGIMSDIEPMTSAKRRRVLQNTEVVVIDEISMVRADLITAVDARLKQLSRGNDKEKPFGGRQIIVVGDFMQLPPVVETATELKYLDLRYGGVYAFETAVWAAAKFHTVDLDTMFRQSDGRFIYLLNRVRIGDRTVVDKLSAEASGKPDDTTITLTPFRAVAGRINEDRLSKLALPECKYVGVVDGRFPKDLPVDEEIVLRIGARVMLSANKYNDDEELEFCNGDLGVVRALSSSAVTVALDSGKTVDVHKYCWEAYDFDLSGSKVVSTKVGSYTQLPIKLAWAVTIHKSQGCTFESIKLDLGRGCFAAGQLYTALSRVRSLSGLALSRPIMPNDIPVLPESIQVFQKVIGDNFDHPRE